MNPSSCSFTITLSQVLTEQDIKNIEDLYNESSDLPLFFTFMNTQGFPFKVMQGNPVLPQELIEKFQTKGSDIIYFQDKIPNTRHLFFNGQKITYSVTAKIPFEDLKNEIKKYVFPLVLAGNCGIWSFTVGAAYKLQSINQKCNLFPEALNDAIGWTYNFAKVIPWEGAPKGLYLIQRDFSAQKKEEETKVTTSFTAQRYPHVQPVLHGDEGRYVLGDVFETAYTKAIESINSDLDLLRG
ncbi:hypothetical protein [Maridesulfovibrio ferrireducens]|uniref:hypothetical protein n=1 Tax=Maridesulfovibrio ferrireducens TaxID=246191 RepID=UPI001A1A1F21|nr:hypothetical protein [Maridesulfovibrio ferrireducens]MBI9113296.1 hypothetical protein [Maridesulfovibrio ferrireducens]